MFARSVDVAESLIISVGSASMKECQPPNAQEELDVKRIVAIVGYRKFTDWALFKNTMEEFIVRYGIPTMVVSGGATGADAMAEKWAKGHAIPIQILRPDWKKYGKAAGILRNTDIVAACTHVVAFPSQKGKGTQDTIRKAIAARKAIMIKNV